MSDERPNCYDCKYRGRVPGDAHSCCQHPEVMKVRESDNEFGQMVQVLGGGFADAIKTLGISAHEQGIRRGWFVWPANFDPTWLLSCKGFTRKPEGGKDG